MEFIVIITNLLFLMDQRIYRKVDTVCIIKITALNAYATILITLIKQ